VFNQGPSSLKIIKNNVKVANMTIFQPDLIKIITNRKKFKSLFTETNLPLYCHAVGVGMKKSWI